MQMLANTIIYLVGPPGVGKYTVGRLLADQLGCKLVDNHVWLNPIFSLLEQDGVTPLPGAVWPLVAQVRSAVLHTIGTVSPPLWNFIFTHAAIHDTAELDIFWAIETLAKQRGADMIVVRLSCSNADELARRVVMPERRDRMKERDVVAARRNALLPTLNPGHPRTISIETTGLTPGDVAQRIVDELQSG
jgi:hypothetical protein